MTMVQTRRRSESKCGGPVGSSHSNNQKKTKFITLKGLHKPLRIIDIIERVLRSYFSLSFPSFLRVTALEADLSRMK